MHLSIGCSDNMLRRRRITKLNAPLYNEPWPTQHLSDSPAANKARKNFGGAARRTNQPSSKYLCFEESIFVSTDAVPPHILIQVGPSRSEVFTYHARSDFHRFAAGGGVVAGNRAIMATRPSQGT